MAVTFDSLMEQIEETAVKCGVEDFEFLAGPDWTIPLLKAELLKWKEILKKKTSEKRAKKSVIKAVKDFFVKSDKVFKGDMYIIDGKYILPGPVAKKSLDGTVFLQIDDEFIDPIRQVLLRGRSEGVWYVDSILAMKQKLSFVIDGNIDPTATGSDARPYSSNIKQIKDGSVIREELSSLLEETYRDIDDFITIPRQTDPQIFTRKKIFKLETEGMPPVLMNIQLLPTITNEEQLEEVEFCLKQDSVVSGKIPVYYIRIRISFTHYIVNLKYAYT